MKISTENIEKKSFFKRQEKNQQKYKKKINKKTKK